MQVQEGVIGRDQERARIEAFLEGPRPAALVIDGEAGIGKTTLWSFALAEAGARGDRVLSWRAGTSERELAFAALMGLAEPGGLGEHLAVLSSPRRAALEVSHGVRHLWTTFVESEETCLSLFEAPDQEAVEQANRSAGFRADRVVEASVVPVPPAGAISGS